MFLLAQEKSDNTIEFLKSELVHYSTICDKKSAASRPITACHHIEYCMDKIQRAKSSKEPLPSHRILNLNHDYVAPQSNSSFTRASKIGTKLKKLDFKYCHLK